MGHLLHRDHAEARPLHAHTTTRSPNSCNHNLSNSDDFHALHWGNKVKE